MKIKIKKLNPAARVPSYAHHGDAAMDFFALEETILKPGIQVAVKTGISMEIPHGYAGLIWDKSGLAIKEGIKTIGGVIDAGYRGEIMIGMINLSNKPYTIEAGHKIAQMLIQKIEACEVEEVGELADLSGSARGQKGFGSTGK